MINAASGPDYYNITDRHEPCRNTCGAPREQPRHYKNDDESKQFNKYNKNQIYNKTSCTESDKSTVSEICAKLPDKSGQHETNTNNKANVVNIKNTKSSENSGQTTDPTPKPRPKRALALMIAQFEQNLPLSNA